MKSSKLTLTLQDIITIRFIGLFGCLSHTQLKKLTNISLRRLNELVEYDYIWKPSKSNEKTFVEVNGKKVLIYILKSKGILALKKYHPDVIYTRSNSVEHDYQLANVFLKYATPSELLTYQSERFIRDRYRDVIQKLELEYNLSISCPDGCFFKEDELYFIEVLNNYNKPLLESKQNFSLCIDEKDVLVIVRFDKEIYRYPNNNIERR